MAFLKLSDIGKIYTSENNVAVGIRKVNLSFEKGEFVAVTGKSGSGKTTLLNVIGGLDSYEEGELYVEGRSTSHYSKADWDEYVAKYVSFIFQDYNILESFTVLENIEFALTAIKDLKERKRRALEIAERVGLKDRLKTKGVKLSGGEKQRTVIARAIAKDSPIILADEPTGNLDSTNAKSILALLKEVSEDKLVIVVTHNYEDVKEYATRHIRIFDGKVESDEVFVKVAEVEYYKENDEEYEKERQYVFKKRHKKQKRSKEEKRVDARDKFILGCKRFTSRPRQNVLIAIILFVALSGIMLSISMTSNLGYNPDYFDINGIEGRVIVASDSTTFTDESAAELAKTYGAGYSVMHDIFLDSRAQFLLPGQTADSVGSLVMNLSDGVKVDKGRLPERSDELVLKVPYNFSNKYKVGDKMFLLSLNSVRSKDPEDNYQGLEYTVVGIDYHVDNREPISAYLTREGYFAYAQFQRLGLVDIVGVVIEVDDKGFPVLTDRFGNPLNYRNAVDINIRVDYNLEGKTVESNVQINEGQGLYVTRSMSVAVLFTDVKYNPSLQPLIPSLYDEGCYVVSVSPEVFADYYTSESTQISLMFGDDKTADKAVEKMTDDGYRVLKASDVAIMTDISFYEKFLNFFSTTLVSLAFSVAIALVVVVTLIKLMILSRKDISVFRTMGIPDATVKASTYVQLFLALIPALILSVVLIVILYFAPIGSVIKFMGWDSVIMIILGIAAILVILAGSYNRLIYRQKIRKGLRRANK